MNTQLKIIAVVGLIGSGKTEATARFIKKGLARVGFNDVVYEELERQGLGRNEKNERMIRESLRKEFGMAVMVERSLSKIEGLLKQGRNVVVESLYSWSEYKLMKEKFGDRFKVLAIYSPPNIRYERLAKREIRPLTLPEARLRDYAEIENIEKAGPIAMADWTIQNIGAREDLTKAVDEVIENLLKN